MTTFRDADHNAAVTVRRYGTEFIGLDVNRYDPDTGIIRDENRANLGTEQARQLRDWLIANVPNESERTAYDVVNELKEGSQFFLDLDENGKVAQGNLRVRTKRSYERPARYLGDTAQPIEWLKNKPVSFVLGVLSEVK